MAGLRWVWVDGVGRVAAVACNQQSQRAYKNESDRGRGGCVPVLARGAGLCCCSTTAVAGADCDAAPVAAPCCGRNPISSRYRLSKGAMFEHKRVIAARIPTGHSTNASCVDCKTGRVRNHGRQSRTHESSPTRASQSHFTVKFVECESLRLQQKAKLTVNLTMKSWSEKKLGFLEQIHS